MTAVHNSWHTSWGLQEFPFSNKEFPLRRSSSAQLSSTLEDDVIAQAVALPRTPDLLKKVRAPVRAISTGSLRTRSGTAPLYGRPSAVEAQTVFSKTGTSLPKLVAPEAPELLRAKSLPNFGFSPEEAKKSLVKRAGTFGVAGDAPSPSIEQIEDVFDIPASRLDLLSPKSLKLEVAAADARHGLAAVAAMWDNDLAAEALGELFATKVLEAGAAGKPVVKSSKKSKKAKDASTFGKTGKSKSPWRVKSAPDAPRRSSRGRRPASTGCLLSQRAPAPLVVEVEEDVKLPPQARPSSASPSNKEITRVADADLWNVGFNDNINVAQDYAPCVWDSGKEVYNAWGGDDDEWTDFAASNDVDWGDDGHTLGELVPVF